MNSAEPIRLPRHGPVVLGVLAVAFLVVAIASTGHGAFTVPPGKILAILAAPLGISLPWSFDGREEAVVLAIRLPRVVFGAIVGGSLAVAGATLQGLFRNPLADPALIGVSSGAGLAAVVVIVLGGGIMAAMPQGLGTVLLPLAAFGGGLVATAVVYAVAQSGRSTDVPTLLLAGVAVNAIANAGLGLMIFLSDDQQLRDLNFWMLGSLNGLTWSKVVVAAPFALGAIIALQFFARHLNALLLGEGEALHLGFDVERTKRSIVVLAALATGATVALTGVILFVGLVVPHLVRIVAGPDHKTLLPASALLGATLLLLADVVARTIVLPAELPIGVVTSCVGGPFFLWLLVRRRRTAGW